MASAGNDVIMDYPLSEPWRLDDLVETLRPYDVTLIDVRCDPEELDRRERTRGDRPVGLARSQTQVYAHGDPDLVIDSTSASPAECAARIVAFMATAPDPKAFRRRSGGR